MCQTTTILVAIGLLCCALPTTLAVYSTTDAANLEDYLKLNYHRTVRPNETTEIAIQVGLFHINALDIVSQHIDLVGWIYLSWTDYRLQWDSSLYGGMNSTMMLQSDVWVPPILLNNAADGLKIISDDSDMASNYVAVSDTGTVYWLTGANFMANCEVSIKYYPFDTQECSMIVSPWGYDLNTIRLYSGNNDINIDLYSENGEWTIVSKTVTNQTRPVFTTALSSVSIKLSMQRKVSYYMINMILPVIALLILAVFVFVLPTESGEKNGYALTILLSMSVVMTIVSDSIPPISTQTCLLSVYLLVVFIICTIITGITVFSCQIHAYTAKGYTPGRVIQKLMKHAAKITLYKRPETEDDQSNKGNQDEEKQKQVSNGDIYINRAKTPSAWQDKTNNEKKAPVEDEPEEEIIYTYEECSFVFDRLNFIFFTAFIFLFTLIFFIILQVDGTATAS